jgi:mutator protein MutT
MSVELMDVYDENKQKTGKVHERGKDQLKEGEYHLAVVVIVRDNNEFLITQRHPSKLCGLMWEFSGGAVQAGEKSIDAAVRELGEETGIVTSKEELKYMDTIFYRKNSMFMDVYMTNRHVELEDLALQAEEVVDAKKVTDEEFIEMNKKGLVTYLDWDTFNVYLKQINKADASLSI